MLVPIPGVKRKHVQVLFGGWRSCVPCTTIGRSSCRKIAIVRDAVKKTRPELN